MKREDYLWIKKWACCPKCLSSNRDWSTPVYKCGSCGFEE